MGFLQALHKYNWCDFFPRNLPTNHKSCTTRFLELSDCVTLPVHQVFDSLSRFPVVFELFDHTTPFVAVDCKQLKICQLGTSLLSSFLRRTHVVRYRASYCFLRVRSLSYPHLTTVYRSSSVVAWLNALLNWLTEVICFKSKWREWDHNFRIR